MYSFAGVKGIRCYVCQYYTGKYGSLPNYGKKKNNCKYDHFQKSGITKSEDTFSVCHIEYIKFSGKLFYHFCSVKKFSSLKPF